MLQPRAVARFAILAIAVYAALTWLWFIPAFERGYSAYFRTIGDASFGSQFWFWPDAKISFLDAGSTTLVADVNRVLPGPLPEGFKPPGERGDRDTLLVIKNKRVPEVPGFLRTSSRFMGFAPTAVLIALCLATPIKWRKRIWLLLWALLLLHFFIIIRLTVLVLKGGLADPDKRNALFRPGDFWWDLLTRLDTILCDNPTFAYLAAVFVWLITLFLMEVWATLRRKPSMMDEGVKDAAATN